MKKKPFAGIICMLIVLIMLFTSMGLGVYANGLPKILINLNGSILSLKVDPIIKNSSTLVPLRGILEKAGAKVSWESTQKQILVEYETVKIVLKIGSKTAQVNGKNYELVTAPILYNGNTMVPVRFIAENLGFVVNWNEKERTVYINTKKEKSKNYSDFVENKILSPNEVVDMKSLSDNYLKVDYRKQDGSTYIIIYGGDYSQHNVFRLTGGERIVVDIPKAKIKDSYGEKLINDDMVSKVRYSQFKADIGRVVIDTLNQYEYYVTYKDNVLAIKLVNPSYKNIRYENLSDREFIIDGVVLNDGENCTTKFDIENNYYVYKFAKSLGSYGTGRLKVNDEILDYLRVVESKIENSIAIKTKCKVSLEIIPDNDKKRTIIRLKKAYDTSSLGIVVIDAGHGGSDPGATYAGVLEKDLNLDIAKRLDKLLISLGIKTKMTRTTDEFVDLNQRSIIANDLNATLFISIHNNAFNKVSNGTETLYNEKMGDYKVGFTGNEFAKIVQDKLIDGLGLTNRGIVNRPDLAVLRNSKMPSVLVEVGFVTNDSDREKLLNEQFRQKAAQCICDGIVDALKKFKII